MIPLSSSSVIAADACISFNLTLMFSISRTSQDATCASIVACLEGLPAALCLFSFDQIKTTSGKGAIQKVTKRKGFAARMENFLPCVSTGKASLAPATPYTRHSAR